MKNTTNLLILNLAVADLLFLLVCVPATASDYILMYWPFGLTWCRTVQYIIYVTAYVSIYTLVLMAGDRSVSLTPHNGSCQGSTKPALPLYSSKRLIKRLHVKVPGGCGPGELPGLQDHHQRQAGHLPDLADPDVVSDPGVVGTQPPPPPVPWVSVMGTFT